MVKITFYNKFSKNGLVSEKKFKKISITEGGGGGSGPYMELSIIFFIFCLKPSLREGLKKSVEFSTLFKTHPPHSQSVEKNKNNMS